tara:strand:- start:83 stop:616 length:534 start_codon:yes stop_codon:yes gene_type:complete
MPLKNKEARAAYNKDHREKNKEAYKAYNKDYREKNKEARVAYNKAYRERNKESRAAYNKVYRERNKEALAVRRKAYNAENKEARAAYNKAFYMLRKYGITLAEKKEMLNEQGNKCKICLQEFNDKVVSCVDHCHTMGKIRGLLCRQCNVGLGNFKDNPLALVKAAEYLKEQGEEDVR